MNLYAVIGNPVVHSQSPRIHTAFGEQTNSAVDYRTIQAEPDSFPSTVRHFFAQGGKGMNVTVPFKQQACAMADSVTERARKAGAVNTLWLEQGCLKGDTTDGIGLIRDLVGNHSVRLTALRVLILGAGGAVRGLLEPLLLQKPQAVVVANRTPARAEKLVADFQGMGTITATGFGSLCGEYDLIINGTSASLKGQVLPLSSELLAKNCVVYDMMYGGEVTPFNRWAGDAGAARTLDGLGMLVEQAAESFFIWHHKRPDTGTVLTDLRADLQQS